MAMDDGVMDGGWRMADDGLVDHHHKKNTADQNEMCFVFIHMHLMCLDLVSVL